MSYKKELLVCRCESLEHQLIFSYDNESYEEVYCSIYLTNYKNFFQRFIHGIKYIFGYKSKFGEFDSIIINPDDHEKFQEIVDILKNIKTKEDNDGRVG